MAAVSLAAAGLWGWRHGKFTRASPTDAQVEAQLAAANLSVSSGQLSGGANSALGHLLTARRLRPHDARVQERLRVLADIFEALGARAIARGDMEEAALHLAAADEADPGRATVRASMDRVRKTSPADAPQNGDPALGKASPAPGPHP